MDGNSRPIPAPHSAAALYEDDTSAAEWVRNSRYFPKQEPSHYMEGDPENPTTKRFATVFWHHPDWHMQLRENPIFVVQIFELLLTASYLFVGVLVLADFIAINHYLFLIFLSIGFAVLAMLHILSIWKWSARERYSYRHVRDVQYSFFFWLAFCLVFIVLLGSYLRENGGGCCDYDDAQPDKTDLVAYNQFISAYVFMVGSFLFGLLFIFISLLSHIYPETRQMNPYSTYTGNPINGMGGVYIDRIDDPEEISAFNRRHR